VRRFGTAIPRGWELVALLAVAFAMAYLVQGPTVNASSHHALVRALASGTPRIDHALGEIGDASTTDVAWYEGHPFSNKAPGLAFVTLPAYLALDAVGQTSRHDPSFVLWALGLVGLVVPALLLLLLVRRLVDRPQPGLGTPVAVVLGLGTLLLPFSTLFFAHVLSAALAFATYAILRFEREGAPRVALVALAGVLAAFAATAEYPVALVGAVLLPYAAARTGALRRAGVYLAGFAAGLVPLLVYNWWALGSPFRLTYRYSVYDPGVSRRDVLLTDVPFSDIWHVPALQQIVSLLLYTWGLVSAAPILALAPVGAYLLYREGRRAEPLIAGVLAAAFVLYSASYYQPYGDTWAPRFLVPLIPFLALPLARACAEYPAIAAGLAAGSIALSAAVTATHPMTAWDGHILDRLLTPPFDGHSGTPLQFVGLVSWWDTLPFFAATLCAGGYAVAVLLRRAEPLGRPERAAGAVALAGWVLFFQLEPRLIEHAEADANVQALVVLALAAALAAAVLATRVAVARALGAAAART
jgi:hypothetical protein